MGFLENRPSKFLRKLDGKTLGRVGNHVVLVKAGVRANLSIPQHKELSIGTLRKLIRIAELTVDEFLELL